MRNEDIPSEYSETRDAAVEKHISEMQDWAARAFTGQPRPGTQGPVQLEVIQQDHSVLNFGRSCIETPITIGKQVFEHGLGTHAASVISVGVPKGAKVFKASVGIDNNSDTQGRGSVEFAIEIDSKEMLRTPVLRGANDPVPVSIDIPQGTERIVLKVDPAADGVTCDQADWANAQFVMQDGASVCLDTGQPEFLIQGTRPPFSFTYGGRNSAELLDKWPREVQSREEADRTIDTVRWRDPDAGLCLTAEVAMYKRYPAVDWVLRFENLGQEDTPIIEDIQALDLMAGTGYFRNPVVLHHLEGDACGENSFMPKVSTIEVEKGLHLAPTGGRPSSISAFPWFNLEYGNRGLITAVGWTGQWAAQFDRSPSGPTRMRAGIEKTHLLLHPGERIRGPRIVLFSWRGERVAAHNLFRRLVLFHYVPRLDKKPLRLPVALQTFDRYNARPGWATEAGQINAAETAYRFGCDTYWLDAAWFPGNFRTASATGSANRLSSRTVLSPSATYATTMACDSCCGSNPNASRRTRRSRPSTPNMCSAENKGACSS